MTTGTESGLKRGTQKLGLFDFSVHICCVFYSVNFKTNLKVHLEVHCSFKTFSFYLLILLLLIFLHRFFLLKQLVFHMRGTTFSHISLMINLQW